ncbi:MAG: PH domain-containing protein [Anaerolineae bacterium]
MTIWDLDIRKGWRLGLAGIVVLVLLAVGLGVLIALTPISLLTFFLTLGALGALVAAVLVGYWLWGLLHAEYAMDRNVLVIRWGGYTHELPMAEIQEVLRGADLEKVSLRRVLHWPGYFVGQGEAQEIGPIFFYATAPLQEQLVLRLPGVAYAISPANPELFLEALEERLEMGATQDVVYIVRHPAFLDWAIWKDPLLLSLLGSALALLLLLGGLLSWRYPTLPESIVLKIDAKGAPLLVGPPSRLAYLGLLALLFTLFNGGLGLVFYRRRPVVTYFLCGGLLLLLTSLWIAILSILFRA